MTRTLVFPGWGMGMPQTMADVWPWLLSWAPSGWQAPIAIGAALLGAFALFATSINAIIDLVRNLAPSSPLSRDAVLRRLVDGKITRADAKFILDQISGDAPMKARERNALIEILLALGVSGRETLRLFTMGDLAKGLEALPGNGEKIARGALERLAQRDKSKYRPLQEFLTRQAGVRISMTFERIGEILAAPLPPSARTHRPWWANERQGSHVQARAWLDAGWRVSSVDLAKATVVFERAA